MNSSDTGTWGGFAIHLIKACLVTLGLTILVWWCFGCAPMGPGDATDCEHGKPHQCEGEQMVWRDLYGERSPAPFVAWRGPGLVNPESGEAADGLHFDSGDVIVLVWHGKLSESSYAHELLHSHLLHEMGDGDEQHQRPEWGTLLPLAQEGLATLDAAAPLDMASPQD